MPSPNIRTGLAVLAGALIAASIASSPAVASIQCKGNFQVIKGHGLISTPYCQERQIAAVARTYGWKVTASEIANNPLKKVRICQALGRDIRLTGSCAGYGLHGHPRIH